MLRGRRSIISTEITVVRKFFAVFALAILLATLPPSGGAAQFATGSPEYDVVPHLMGYPETTPRDVQLITGAGFQWVKLTVPWRSVEASCKGCIDWVDLDRVMLALSGAGLKVLARVDHPPAWARAIPAENGPPDDYYNYADFVSEMARRYATGSPKGTIRAIQVWNEPNLSREWGGTGVEPIISRRSAVEYMSLLRQSYQLIKEKDPTWTQDFEQWWWSLTETDGTPRPAYTAIQTARTSGALP